LGGLLPTFLVSVANVNIGRSREGLGGRSPCAGVSGNQVPPHPRPQEGLGGRSPCTGVSGNQVPPHPRPQEGLGGRSPCAGVWGNPVSPYPHPVGGFGRATPSSGGMGEPGSPTPPPAGGFGRAQPSQEEPFFIPSVCGAAAWTADMNMGRPAFSRPRPTARRQRPEAAWRGVGKPGFPTLAPVASFQAHAYRD